MKKNYFKLMMLALMLAIAIPTAGAHDFEVDGIYYNIDGDEAIVTYQGDYYSSYIEYQGSVTIPTTVTYEGTTYSVTAIGDYAFSNCTGLTSVTIPNSVTSIGDRTFRCCSGLTSVTIGESVTTIGEDAFNDCSSLTTLNYNAVCYADSTLSSYDYPFNGTSISTIIIGENVQKVPCFFVHGLSSLANLSVESGNTTYDSRDNCNAIIETASNTLVLGCMNTVIPNSVATIGDYALNDCTGLTSVTIPESVTIIGESAFSGCSGLTSVTIPESVTSIGSNAFKYCSSLTTLNYNAESCASFSSFDHPFYRTSISTINIGESVQKIPAYFAYRLWNLTSVTIPESVTTIGYAAFSYTQLTTLNFNAVSCADFTYMETRHPFYKTGISTIIIGESVQRVPRYFVNALDSLASISVESGNATYDSRDNCNAIIATASNTLVAGCKSTFIPESVTAIGDYAFYGCRGLMSVTIPESVSAIGKQAFKDCRLLTALNYNAVCCADFSSNSLDYPFDKTSIFTIIIGENVQKVPAYFLNGLSTLVSLSVESGNTTYDSRDNCNAIIATSSNTLVTGCKNTVIPKSVTTIGDCAFYNCTGLTSVDIPNTVTTIGKDAFYWCTALTSVTIGNSVSTIDDQAFYHCNDLTSVDIPNSVTYIGKHAFDGCTGLTSMTIGNSVTIIEMYAFWGCSGLTSVTIPESVTYIGGCAFDNCTGLTSVTIPKSVKTLGYDAFSSCTGLTSVTISSSTTTIGYFAFNGCPALMSVTCLTAIPPKAYSSFYSNATLYVPKGAVQIYQTTSYWEEFPTIVGIDVDVDLPGDVNNDGVLDITDVTGIITLLLVNSDEYLSIGDVNGDGVFTIADVTDLINQLLIGAN